MSLDPQPKIWFQLPAWRWVLIVGAGFPLLWTFWLVVYAFFPGPSSGAENILTIIPPNTSFRNIQEILAQKGVIRNDIRFALLAELRGISRKIKAGEYSFSEGGTPWEVLTILAKGEVLRQPVTIPEGFTIASVAAILSQEKWVDQTRFLALTEDKDFIAELGLSASSLEGYLFPDTYNLNRGMDDKAVIRMMVNRALSLYQEMTSTLSAPHDLSRHQVLTLASIVEKETGRAEERPLVAAVFLNRLRQGIPLQADPTVIYALTTSFDGDLNRQHLRTPSPYNTYLVKGLPPGPIANPGRAAIEAVLAPAASPYLYFVAKNDGTHFFSTSLTEHNRAVRQYQGNRQLSGNE